jgi:two-component system sensor histidine kinase/response regulator
VNNEERPIVILNVDDSEPARYARSRILQRAGFVVHEASNGEEALDRIASYQPDLVTLDVHLPDISGIEVCRRVKAKPESASTVVVQISASAISAPHATSALNNGADAYLMEPVDPDVLVATVRAMLRLRKAERDLAEANKVLANLNQELRRSNEDLQQFAFMASHDLQEPLRMVNTYTQLLVRRFGHLAAPEVPEYARFINEGVQQMDTLIQNVLSYSRAIHSDDEGQKTADLGRSFKQALSLLDDKVQESNATITCEELPVLRGNEQQLAQVFQNLLSNALKYRKDSEPVRVHVSARRDGSNWITSVRDNGIGFDQKYAEQIFGLFKRLHRAEYSGTGLGLAICKRIVDWHGGRIYAESKPGVGSTFSFSLPD